MGRILWQARNEHQIVAEVDHHLWLSVVPTEAPDTIRFVVTEGEDGEHGLPVISGYRSSVTAAMEAAEDAAARLSNRLRPYPLMEMWRLSAG